jgi:hypothetical protein
VVEEVPSDLADEFLCIHGRWFFVGEREKLPSEILDLVAEIREYRRSERSIQTVVELLTGSTNAEFSSRTSKILEASSITRL